MLENFDPSSRVEPRSSRSIVRFSSTTLAGPDNSNVYEDLNNFPVINSINKKAQTISIVIWGKLANIKE